MMAELCRKFRKLAYVQNNEVRFSCSPSIRKETAGLRKTTGLLLYCPTFGKFLKRRLISRFSAPVSFTQRDVAFTGKIVWKMPSSAISGLSERKIRQLQFLIFAELIPRSPEDTFWKFLTSGSQSSASA